MPKKTQADRRSRKQALKEQQQKEIGVLPEEMNSILKSYVGGVMDKADGEYLQLGMKLNSLVVEYNKACSAFNKGEDFPGHEKMKNMKDDINTMKAELARMEKDILNRPKITEKQEQEEGKAKQQQRMSNQAYWQGMDKKEQELGIKVEKMEFQIAEEIYYGQVQPSSTSGTLFFNNCFE